MLTAAQQSHAALIVREFTAAGWKPSVAAAAVVNAYAESRLNPLAVGDGGKSVGLFQLHERGGGAGMTVEQRKDPTLNTRRIIEETGRALKFRAIAAVSDDIPTLAAAFSTYVERPKDVIGEESKRAALARALYPSGLPVATPSTTPLSTPAAPSPASPASDNRSTYWLLALAAVAIGSVLLFPRFRGASDAS